MWGYPYQARVSTIDEAVKQLAQLASTRPNWPYALVQLNRDAHHVPLPTEGHLSVMMEGNTSNVSCGKICQLAVHQLLSSGSWVVYLEGLNGCQVPVIMSLPESLSKGMTMLEDESTFLQVILSQSATKEQESKALFLSSHLSTTLAASPTRAFPHKAEGQTSMTMEVSELLSQAVLDTTGLASRSSTPKRPGSLALATPLCLKPEDFAKPVDTSSQVSIPDDVEMDDPILEEINAFPSHPVETPGPSGGPPYLDVAQLQEDTNKALGCILAMRSMINACQRKEVSDFGMALQQNESEITKAIKALKALHACTIRDAEACWAVLIGKAKVWHAACIKEAEANCAHVLAEAENCCSWGASQAHLIQQSHAKDIQHLEAEAIEEEKRDWLTFLTTCSTALMASPPEAHGIRVTPFHLLLGNAPTSTLLSISPGASPFNRNLLQRLLLHLAP